MRLGIGSVRWRAKAAARDFSEETLPAASGLDEIPVDPEVAEVARILVRFEAPARSVRVNITLSEDLLAEVDRFAKRHGFTRSGLLAQAAREHIRNE
jgi:hypothetical protein